MLVYEVKFLDEHRINFSTLRDNEVFYGQQQGFDFGLWSTTDSLSNILWRSGDLWDLFDQ